MRKVVISVLTISLLLLTGCGEREAQLESGFSAFREAVTMASRITATAEITADYGQTVSEYTIAMAYDGQQTVLQVLAPDIISGVTATAERGDTTICYGDVLLETGALDEEGLTPMSALPVILDAMTSGYTELLWWEDDYITARLYAGETSVCTVWLDKDDLAPIQAEISSEGQRVISCIFEDWKIS